MFLGRLYGQKLQSSRIFNYTLQYLKCKYCTRISHVLINVFLSALYEGYYKFKSSYTSALAQIRESESVSMTGMPPFHFFCRKNVIIRYTAISPEFLTLSPSPLVVCRFNDVRLYYLFYNLLLAYMYKANLRHAVSMSKLVESYSSQKNLLLFIFFSRHKRDKMQKIIQYSLEFNQTLDF